MTRNLNILACAWSCILCCPSVDGQGHPSNRGCAGDILHHRLASNPDEFEQLGLSKAEALDALACIATSSGDGAYTFVPFSAVGSLFGLANAEEARVHLLEVIANPATRLEAHILACYLLVYVSDANTNEQVFQLLVLTAPRSNKRVNYMAYFREVEYPKYVEWLRGEVKLGVEVPVPLNFLKQELRYADLRGNGKEIIARLKECDQTLDAKWLVRHGLKAGIPKEQMRSAILAAVEHRQDCRDVFLINAARSFDELVGFDEESKIELGRIRQSMEHPDEDHFPKWARERIHASRKAYYRAP